jgi:uncharacterized membrane protein YhhN
MLEQIVLFSFIFVSLVHLIAAFFKFELIRKISKLLLMPLLLSYFFTLKGLYVPVLLAAIFAFLGDFFLIEPQKPIYFKLGLVSFLLGHLCYIPAFISLTGNFHIPVLIVSYIIAIALGLFMIKTIAPEKSMIIPVILYTFVILHMSIFALQLMLSNSHFESIMIFIGSILFICSDTILALFTFHTMPKRGNFFIMLTYILAQALIITGLGRLIL